jgi:hypothetical protein
MPGFLREAMSGRNPFVLRISVIAAIGGFLFGYDIGVISGALLYSAKGPGSRHAHPVLDRPDRRVLTRPGAALARPSTAGR